MKPEYGLAPVGRDTPGVHALIDGPYRTGVIADGDFWVGTKHLREQISFVTLQTLPFLA
jgi:hypothetical protein